MVPQIKEVIKNAGFKIPKTVTDDETGDILQPDEKTIERALFLVAKARSSIFEAAEAVSNFFSEKLYLYLGLTKQEAGEQLFGMSASSVRNLQLIHERLGDEQRLSILDSTKLVMIAKLPEEQRKEIITDGLIRLADGSVMTIEDIAGDTVKDLQGKLKTLSNKNTSLNTQLKEEEKIHKSEVKELKQKLEESEALLNIPEEDRAFYAKVTKKRDIQNIVFEAQSYMHSAFMTLARIDGDAKDAGSSIEGFITTAARKLLDLEEQFGASAAYYKTTLKAMAGEK
jgi:hypothetical protein